MSDICPNGSLLIKCSTRKQRDEYLVLAWSIIERTGGWVGRFDDTDKPGRLAFRLITHQASVEELEELWKRVLGGQDAKEAHAQVAGPSFHYFKRR